MSNIDESAEFLQGFSTQALQRAVESANRTQVWDIQAPNVSFSHTVRQPALEKPASIGDLLDDYEKQDVNVIMLNGIAEDWIARYLPNLHGCLKDQPDEWVCGILSGEKPFGMNKSAFDAAWHEARDRAFRQASTERKETMADYASRGFSQPPGATLAALRSAEIRASDAIGDVNRQQAIKDAEIKVELVKLAVETATQLRTALMQLLASFFGNIVALANHDPGSDKMRAKAQAYSAFMGGLSSFYNVELGFEQLRLEAAKAKSSVQVDSAKVKADLTAKGVDSRNSALGQAANGFATAAGAAANAQGTLQAELFSGGI